MAAATGAAAAAAAPVVGAGGAYGVARPCAPREGLWNGGVMLPSRHEDERPIGLRFRMLSYHLLAQNNAHDGAFPLCARAALNWHNRRELIMREVVSYAPDVITFQDMDYYTEWWQPQMSALGYDGVFVKVRAPQLAEGQLFRRLRMPVARVHVCCMCACVYVPTPPSWAAERSRAPPRGHRDIFSRRSVSGACARASWT
jgi:hypothetical protein